jgi:ABC-2 type transport system ATP-binding protein
MIEFEHLGKDYGGVSIVDDLTFSITEGEVFGFLGPNGAGKTTTIFMMIGLVEPTRGTCHIGGHDVKSEPREVKRLISYMPDEPGFYRNLTASQNLNYFGRLYGLDTATRQARIEPTLKRLNLYDNKKPVGSYSRGMIQRLGIAKLFLNDAKVMILDEPTANLDPPGVALFRDIMSEFHEQGKTIVMSSHVLDEVKRICTSIGLLSKGNLINHGSIDSINSDLIKGKNFFRIFITARDPLPRLEHNDLIFMETARDMRSAIITSKSDLRSYLGKMLLTANNPVENMSLEQPHLEELFLKISS